MNSFTYNGINSADMGLRIESKDVFSAPEYELEFVAIPGRNGNLIQPDGRFGNIQVTYSVFLPAKSKEELAAKLTAVKNWLYAEPDRYHELTDSYDTSFYRKAVFSNNLSITDELNKIGVFTVCFSCMPFRYTVEGQTAVTIQSGDIICNDYSFSSKPLIRVGGTGDGLFRIQNSGGTKTWTLTGIRSYLYIDSESMLCYKISQNMSSCVSGIGFPELMPGNNTITFSGDISSMKITPRWCSL